KNRIEGETICKGWCRLGKETKPRDIISMLRKQTYNNSIAYEKNSEKMTELAKDYHNNLQSAGIEPDTAKREQCTKEVLSHITAKPTEEQREELEQPITEDEIKEALKHSKKDSAAGINGLTYEFWADIYKQCEKEKDDKNEDAFDIIKILKAAFNDIQKNGVDPSTNFAKGW
ncbi:uncharacterized protein C8Q71DRAFT_674280, partial [Rhodofomes roseus]